MTHAYTTLRASDRRRLLDLILLLRVIDIDLDVDETFQIISFSNRDTKRKTKKTDIQTDTITTTDREKE